LREAGEPVAIAIVRPVAPIDAERAAAWATEARRIASRVLPGPVGYCDESALQLARGEWDEPLDEVLLEAAVDRPDTAPAWRAGVVDADAVTGDLVALRRAASDALEAARA